MKDPYYGSGWKIVITDPDEEFGLRIRMKDLDYGSGLRIRMKDLYLLLTTTTTTTTTQESRKLAQSTLYHLKWSRWWRNHPQPSYTRLFVKIISQNFAKFGFWNEKFSPQNVERKIQKLYPWKAKFRFDSLV